MTTSAMQDNMVPNLTLANYKAAATTNATLVIAGITRLQFLSAHNTSAAVKFLKIYDKATAPTVGTDVPKMVFPIPAGSYINPDISFGLKLKLGLSFAITGGVADTDTTATAANDVIVNMGYRQPDTW